jgi:uncharacterized protein
MAGKFEIKKASNGEFFFNLLAGNGQIVLSSEMYKAKASAQNGIESVRKNCVDALFHAQGSQWRGNWPQPDVCGRR